MAASPIDISEYHHPPYISMSHTDFNTSESVGVGGESPNNEIDLSNYEGKEVAMEYMEKYVVHNPAMLEVPDQAHLRHELGTGDKEQQICKPPPSPWSRKWLWVSAAALLVLTIVAVLGGVLGSRNSNSSSTPPPPPSETSTISPTPTPSPTPTGNGTDPLQQKIAALAFTSSNTNNTRVYYQEQTGALIEGANTAATNETWAFSTLGHFENPNSALAAAVSRPNFTHEISVYYTDKNYLLHDLIYDSTSRIWGQGTLSKQNYVTYPNSSIAAMYNQCLLCANTTLVAYQDINGFVEVANFTSSGWHLTQLSVDATLGTGLAMQPFYRPGEADQINLYYQTSTSEINLASWHPNLSIVGHPGWVNVEQSYKVGVHGTPLAAASSYTSVPPGLETWIQLLQLTVSGIEVNTWSGDKYDWLEQGNHPSIMANSTANTRTFGAIAATALGSAFAVIGSAGNVSIESWQANEDMLSWTSTGTVAILQ